MSEAKTPLARAWQGTFGDMHATILQTLQNCGHRGDRASILASNIAMSLCTTLGGRVVYLPRGDAVRRAERDLRIFSDWSELGLAPADLSKKYRLAVQTIYEIIDKQRKIATPR